MSLSYEHVMGIGVGKLIFCSEHDFLGTKIDPQVGTEQVGTKERTKAKDKDRCCLILQLISSCLLFWINEGPSLCWNTIQPPWKPGFRRAVLTLKCWGCSVGGNQYAKIGLWCDSSSCNKRNVLLQPCRELFERTELSVRTGFISDGFLFISFLLMHLFWDSLASAH